MNLLHPHPPPPPSSLSPSPSLWLSPSRLCEIYLNMYRDFPTNPEKISSRRPSDTSSDCAHPFTLTHCYTSQCAYRMCTFWRRTGLPSYYLSFLIQIINNIWYLFNILISIIYLLYFLFLYNMNIFQFY